MSSLSLPINCVLLSGRVAKAGVLKRSAQGNVYLRFELGFIERRRDAANDTVIDSVSFIDCIVFGDRAKQFASELVKDRRIGVQGRLSWNKFTDPKVNGSGRHQLYVDRIDFDSFDPANKAGD